METTDKEVQTLEQLYALRKQAVRLHRKGMPVMRIVTATGISWPSVRSALDLYERGGMAALKPPSTRQETGYGSKLDGKSGAESSAHHLRQAPGTDEDGFCPVEPACRYATH